MTETTLRSGGRASPLVCIIGGGGTGAALAYDLSLRGLSVVLLERGELTSGTTGRHHGQLHSGARYALADRNIARECYEESLVLRRIAPEAIEYNGGLFVALSEEEAEFAPSFLEACRQSGIPAEEIPASRALELEPALNPALKRAIRVPDGSFDAFRLPLSFFAAARSLGADIRPWHEVLGLELEAGRLVRARVLDRSSDPIREYSLEADFFLGAAGAWAGELGALAGLDLPISPAPGSMVAARGRLTDAVISRLRPASDGDILVPQRGLSIIGSTQRLAEDPDALLPPPEEIAFLEAAAAELVPAFAQAPFQAAWSAARPLAGRALDEEAGRSASRDFVLLDHEAEGVQGFLSVVGGKATVLRAMAEQAADAACRKLGLETTCRTAEFALPSWRRFYAGGRS